MEMNNWTALGFIICIALVILGLIGSIAYYCVIKLEHQTERLSTLDDVDRCLYICGDVNTYIDSTQRIACFEKCEDNYVNLQTLKLVQNG